MSAFDGLYTESLLAGPETTTVVSIVTLITAIVARFWLMEIMSDIGFNDFGAVVSSPSNWQVNEYPGARSRVLLCIIITSCPLRHNKNI